MTIIQITILPKNYILKKKFKARFLTHKLRKFAHSMCEL